MIQEDISEIEMDTSKDCHGIHDGIHGLKRKHGWTPWLFMGIEISMFHGYPPWIEHLEFSKTVIVQVKMPSPLKWSFETRRPSGVFSVEVSQVRGGPQVTLVVSRLKWSSMGDDDDLGCPHWIRYPRSFVLGQSQVSPRICGFFPGTKPAARFIISS